MIEITRDVLFLIEDKFHKLKDILSEKIIFIGGQLTELSKYTFVAIVTTVLWQIFMSPVSFNASVNQILSSEHLLYLNYLQ